MLSKEEELKLEFLSKIISISKEDCRYPQLTSYDMEWLAERLKKVNDELSQTALELQKTNEELARFREHYEG